MVIISDTSCLIVLRKLNRLDLLRDLYGTITVTDVIADEFGMDLPDWFTIVNVPESPSLTDLEKRLDPGEASAIRLTQMTPDSLLIIDEAKGRAVAQEMALPLIGTLGLLIKAKEAGLLESLKPILTRIRTETDFRFSGAVEIAILRKADEIG